MQVATVDSNGIYDVVVVGAGFSGVCTGIKLRENGIDNFIILEKNEGVGGTWWHNRYPGAQCDVPSHLYCFSFEMNPNWSRRYAPQAEIQQYLEGLVGKYDLGQHLHNGVEVLHHSFDDASKLWKTHMADGTVLRSHHVIRGSGALNVPAYPNIPGRDSFQGTSMHSMEWDPAFDYSGKRIALIGSAASAIQILPPVSETAAQVTMFQRSPNYIAPRIDPIYDDRARTRFRRFPWLMKLERAMHWAMLETVFFSATRKRSMLRRVLSNFMIKHMKSAIDDPELQRIMTPDHKLGCKRPLISSNFYPALNRDNTHVETTPIEAIEATGVRTSDGQLHQFDAIVYATGFNLSKAMNLDVAGPGGCTLAEQWSQGAAAFEGNSIPNMPNFYLITGPNVALGNMSFVYVIESQVNYIMKCLKASGNNHLLRVREKVSSEYNESIQQALADETIWFDGCRNWFLNEAGRCEVNYPWHSFTLRRQLRKLDLSNYELIAK